MKNRIFIIGGLVVIAVALVVFATFQLLKGGKSIVGLQPQEQQVIIQGISASDPVDLVSDFYNAWLNAVNSTTTDPYKSGLAKATVLNGELSKRIVAAQGTTTDPVLCQTKTPSNISTRTVYQLDNKEELLVTAKDADLTGQAIITVVKNGDTWSIDNIECAAGEFAPATEFTFEKVGFLLKSVPPPYDPKNWHLVFEEDGVQGHVVPLFFDAKSMCTDPNGATAVCSPDKFVQTTKVTVHGDMTELGVDVKKMELTNDEYTGK